MQFILKTSVLSNFVPLINFITHFVIYSTDELKLNEIVSDLFVSYVEVVFSTAMAKFELLIEVAKTQNVRASLTRDLWGWKNAEILKTDFRYNAKVEMFNFLCLMTRKLRKRGSKMRRKLAITNM